MYLFLHFNVCVPADENSGNEEPNQEKDNDENENQDRDEDKGIDSDKDKDEDKGVDNGEDKDKDEDKGMYMWVHAIGFYPLTSKTLRYTSCQPQISVPN